MLHVLVPTQGCLTVMIQMQWTDGIRDETNGWIIGYGDDVPKSRVPLLKMCAADTVMMSLNVVYLY